MLRFLETSGIIAFIATAAWIIHALGFALPSTAALALALPAGFFLGDLFSGLVHWVCDTFGSSTTPLLGPALIHPFRHHHEQPGRITRISLVENLGASAIVGWLFLLLWVALSDPRQAAGFADRLQQWVGFLFIIFSVLSNLLHRWAHIPDRSRPGWIRLLQRWHLVIPTEQHMLHHRPPWRTNYCIMCGWGNAVTNRIPWDAVESLLAEVGIRTHNDQES